MRHTNLVLRLYYVHKHISHFYALSERLSVCLPPEVRTVSEERWSTETNRLWRYIICFDF